MTCKLSSEAAFNLVLLPSPAFRVRSCFASHSDDANDVWIAAKGMRLCLCHNHLWVAGTGGPPSDMMIAGSHHISPQRVITLKHIGSLSHQLADDRGTLQGIAWHCTLSLSSFLLKPTPSSVYARILLDVLLEASTHHKVNTFNYLFHNQFP